MPVKSKRINLSVPPSKVPKIRDTGKKNRLHSRDGSLNDATICTELILFMCEMQSDQDVEKHLAKTGGILLDLIRRSVKKEIENG